jgi:hypothetical protein
MLRVENMYIPNCRADSDSVIEDETKSAASLQGRQNNVYRGEKTDNITTLVGEQVIDQLIHDG